MKQISGFVFLCTKPSTANCRSGRSHNQHDCILYINLACQLFCCTALVRRMCNKAQLWPFARRCRGDTRHLAHEHTGRHTHRHSDSTENCHVDNMLFILCCSSSAESEQLVLTSSSTSICASTLELHLFALQCATCAKTPDTPR